MPADPISREVWRALGLAPAALDRLAVTGEGALPSVFPVTAFAAAMVGAAALALSELGGEHAAVAVDQRLASLWFGGSIKPLGWEVPPPWDPIAGDYRAGNGWIRLHTNAPHHRAAVLAVLGCEGDRDAVAKVVSGCSANALEAAIVAAGGCAAAMQTRAEWAAHEQGQAVASEPLIAFARAAGVLSAWRPDPARPLAGLRVLDLTRVLAGPVATRFLAGFGAEVLRIDPPGWDEPGVVPEVTVGKRCARLDLRSADGRAIFERLLAGADILVHGYRADALDALGLGEAARRAIRPGLIDVALDAYGWSGPWRHRRGFDSLVQMSAGIAAAGMAWQGADRPVPLPVQALDHGTGYLMAAAAIRGVIARLRGEGAITARLSLARTAGLLREGEQAGPAIGAAAEDEYSAVKEMTAWGPAQRLLAPMRIDGAGWGWDRPASALGSADAAWSD
jgi:crotonobetainyl-CoA:carnitine CoA-transferase CaiB-like acyl-CoA transferase